MAGRPDEVGAPREAMVRKYLQSILPPTIGVAKGHIIYKRLKQEELILDISLEFDILLYDAQQSTVFPWDGDELIKAIPFEHIYGVIEVKSILTDEQAQNVSKKRSELNDIIKEAVKAAVENPRPSSLPSLSSLIGKDIDEKNFDLNFLNNFENISIPDHAEAELDKNVGHPEPFFYAFAFSQKIEKEFDGFEYFCDHANLASGKPDGIFIFDSGYCLRRRNDSVMRAIALLHGATIEDASNSVKMFDEEMYDVGMDDPSYRKDYWKSDSIQQTECLAAFLNIVASSCEISRLSNDRYRVDLGQLLGLWLKSSPIAATLGRFLSAKEIPVEDVEEGAEEAKE